MKALTAVMKALSVPLMILNLLGAIVSGIWLVLIGEWRPVGVGIFFFFGSSFLLSFALMPGLLLAAPAAWFAAKGKTLGLVLFRTLSSIYTLTLVTLWCLDLKDKHRLAHSCLSDLLKDETWDTISKARKDG